MTAHQTRPTTRTAGETGAGDEWVTCPGCSRDILVIELCDHDATTGPVCLDRCCEIDHPVGRWAA